MKSKKVTMLAAALVVAVIAAAGIGYAVQYTAETSNANNSVSTTYLTLEQGNDLGAYTNNFFDKVYFNSVNKSKTETEYKPVLNYKYDASAKTLAPATVEQGANLSLISRALSLIVKPTNNELTGVTLNVTVSDFTPVTGIYYKMVIVDTTNNEAVAYDYNETNKNWTFSLTISATQNTTFNVYLLISGTGSTDAGTQEAPKTPMSATVGFTNYVEGSAAGSIFTFKIVADTTVASG